MIRERYLRLYDRLFDRPRRVLLAVVCAAGAAATIVPRIGLDMSFRPLFGQDDGALETTREFESVFGQRSGAYVGAILTPALWDARFVEALRAASNDVAGLEHVGEALSLTRAATAVWAGGSEASDAFDGPSGYGPAVESRWIVDPAALDPLSARGLAAVLSARAAPALERTLVSTDGTRTLLLARLDLPLQDLERRARVLRRIRDIVDARFDGLASRDWIGISIVEEAYARLVLRGLALSFLVTTLVLLVVLLLVFRRIGAVAAIMSGVIVALPVSLAVMVVRGQAITIINSMVPTMIMIIGVGDSIHMFECFADHARVNRKKDAAVRAMFGDMAVPCLLTSLTTIGGLLALETARIEALREFGLNVALGVAFVYVANLLALPALLRVLPESELLAPRRAGSVLAVWREGTADLLVRRPVWVMAASAASIVACVAGAQRLDVDQRFNEDVAEDHPVRVAQDVYEAEFTGFLGPDVRVRRRDGSTLLECEDRTRLASFVAAVEAMAGVIHVESVLDYLPDAVGADRARSGLALLRRDPHMGARVRDVIDEKGQQTAVVVHTADIGSRAALELVERIGGAAEQGLGADYEVDVVGQWWLAQLGLSTLLRDMLVAFGTSCVVVLPLLALTLGSGRLFLVAVAPNLLPPLFALGFMGWMGISVRVGTAMILAIALAIAIDDTIHVLVRLERERRATPDPGEQVRRTLRHTGGPLLLTTVVLVAGFLGMRINGLLAIQEMGIVAAATLTVAFLADVYFLPASYLFVERWTGAAAPPGPGRFGSTCTARDEYVERRMRPMPRTGQLPSRVTDEVTSPHVADER